MKNLTVIILTYNENAHLERCIQSVKSIAQNILVFDSFSIDSTVEIAKKNGCIVYQRKWINYSDQFIAALDFINANIDCDWLLRLDADEYLEIELVQYWKTVNLDSVDGVTIDRKLRFEGKWIKYGGYYPVRLLRFWRNGLGTIERRQMDEHIVLNNNARIIDSKLSIVDENLNTLFWWTQKHLGYAKREALDFFSDNMALEGSNIRAVKVRSKKRLYYKCPMFIRAVLYFLYRYIFRFGFLDGKKGFIWHFYQGLWYRVHVDYVIWKVKNNKFRTFIEVNNYIDKL